MDAGAFRTLPELKTLNLEFNKIKILTQQSFQGLTKLTTLELTGNKHCDIKPNAFNGLPTLLELHLGEMDLDTFDLNLLKSLHSLATLDLHGNKLKTLYWTVLSSLTNLKHIDLSGNQLTTIPSNMSTLSIQIETNKGSINLGNNPWKCNSEIKWLKNMSVSFSSVFSIGNIICDTPANLKYISLINVPDPKLEPILPKILYCDKTKVTVNAGSAVFINCTIKGDSTTVTWINPTGTSFVSSPLQQNDQNVYVNGSLYMASTSSADRGNWTLSVSSKFGEDQRAVYVNVILSPKMKTTTTTTPHKITTTTPIRTTIVTTDNTTLTTITTTPPIRTATSTTSSKAATRNVSSKVVVIEFLPIVTTDTTLKTPEKNSAPQITESVGYFVLVVCTAIACQLLM
ncbi:matrix-remodeling-associated protein 5-like [Mytilus californianus]|uniref:matrix-remodeling-associated protein 5-like n=1 Tax=Mytilus californianus TaxID=6549 RepID=UPI002247B203|nr:matrix-remodeling-associated protein 5-like [Mytilus californianus]